MDTSSDIGADSHPPVLHEAEDVAPHSAEEQDEEYDEDEEEAMQSEDLDEEEGEDEEGAASTAATDERARSMLQGDTDVLLAVAQVLQEAHLLRRSTVNEHGEVEEQLVRQPEAPRPSLPTGYNSWVVETPANVRR